MVIPKCRYYGRGCLQGNSARKHYKPTDVFEKIKCERKDCYYKKCRLTKQEIVKEFYNGDLKGYPKKKILVKKVIPVLVEITPKCDYAQKKWRNAKMVMGVLWPESLEGEPSTSKKLKSADFIYKSLPVEYNGEIYHLTFNAHHLFNVSLKLFGSCNTHIEGKIRISG